MTQIEPVLSPSGKCRACRSVLVFAGFVLVLGCNAKPTDDMPQGPGDGTPVVKEVRAERPGLPERVPESEPPAPIIGEVPDALLTRIRADLAARTGLDPEAFAMIRAEAVTWNDGSLGCPQPDEYYAQVLVEGYWVVLSHLDREYDYRVGRNGEFRLCAPRSPRMR